MKSIHILTIIILLLVPISLVAQHPKEIKNSEVDGIYKTYEDFKTNKMERPTDRQHSGDKIKLKQFFISPDIVTIEQGKKTLFYKDSIFAIKLVNGENYRFINRTPCLITDTSYLYIYSHKTMKTVFKLSGPRTRREDIPVTYLFFSIGSQDTVFSLTLDNVRQYVLTDTFVHFAVCRRFKTEEMLSRINTQTGRFELNETILSTIYKK